MTVFFLFLPRKTPAPTGDWMFTLVKNYVRWTVRRPAPMLAFRRRSFSCSPRSRFRRSPSLPSMSSTHSMEPKHSDAGYALKTIMRKCRPAGNRSSAWCARETRNNCTTTGRKSPRIGAKLQKRRSDQELFHAGRAGAFATTNANQSRKACSAIDFAAARARARSAIAAEGFSRDTFAPAFKFLDQLQAAANPANVEFPIGEHCCRNNRAGGFWSIVILRRIRFSPRIRHHKRAGRQPGAKGNAAPRASGRRACR